MVPSTPARKPESNRRIAPGDRHHRAATLAKSGFTLIELIAVVVILAVIAVVTIPVVIDLRMEANVAALRTTFGAFVEGMRLAKGAWIAKSDGGAVLDLPGYGDGTVDFDSIGYPLGTSVADPVLPGALTDNRCAEIFKAMLPGKTVAPWSAYPAAGFDYAARGDNPLCLFYPLRTNGTWVLAPGCGTGMMIRYTEVGTRFVELYWNCSLDPDFRVRLG